MTSKAHIENKSYSHHSPSKALTSAFSALDIRAQWQTLFYIQISVSSQGRAKYEQNMRNL